MRDSGCRICVTAPSVSAVTLAQHWGLLQICIPPTATAAFGSGYVLLGVSVWAFLLRVFSLFCLTVVFT